MGYEMSKPNLRAELEADLKLVSEGRKDKRSVLQHYIQKYKSIFVASARKAKKFVAFDFYFVEYDVVDGSLPRPHLCLGTN